jgi:hypothetical protein
MIRLNLSFQSEYSRSKSLLRVIFFPLLFIVYLFYFLLILAIFYVLCLVGMIQTIITKSYPNYASKWAIATGQYLLRVQMFFLGLNDTWPSFKLSYVDSDLIQLEVDKQKEYSRILSIAYLLFGWMLVVPQLIWYIVISLYVFVLAVISWVENLLRREHLGRFYNVFIYYEKLGARLFAYFTGLRQEYPTFDLSEVEI